MMNRDELAKAVKLLKEGKLIVFPTETVYALAGDARNITAIQHIFELKKRRLNQPLSVLLAKEHPLNEWVCDLPPLAEKLAAQFWPGPLTLILKKKKSVLNELTGGQAKIALRVPDHPIAQAILKSFGGGLAAPSANRSTHLSPTQIEHVRQEFNHQIPLFIAGGPCSVGIESTIIDMTFEIPRILRLGGVSLVAIKALIPYEIKEPILFHTASSKPLLKQIPKQRLDQIINRYLEQHKTLIVFGLSSTKKKHKNLTWIAMPNEASKYGQVLYQYLHEAERNVRDEILIECVPKLEAWGGIQLILDKYS
jgi:L-threonylcarbamoyladenylate synthase